VPVYLANHEPSLFVRRGKALRRGLGAADQAAHRAPVIAPPVKVVGRAVQNPLGKAVE
jgi:hypothetical protein